MSDVLLLNSLLMQAVIEQNAHRRSLENLQVKLQNTNILWILIIDVYLFGLLCLAVNEKDC
jgi:hypothetical protein